jgi:hypothetical protein
MTHNPETSPSSVQSDAEETDEEKRRRFLKELTAVSEELQSVIDQRFNKRSVLERRKYEVDKVIKWLKNPQSIDLNMSAILVRAELLSKYAIDSVLIPRDEPKI